MTAEQISIFNFVDQDDVKENLKALSINEETELLGFKIRLNERGYEIESEEQHIGFLSFEECYFKINQ